LLSEPFKTIPYFKKWPQGLSVGSGSDLDPSIDDALVGTKALCVIVVKTKRLAPTHTFLTSAQGFSAPQCSALFAKRALFRHHGQTTQAHHDQRQKFSHQPIGSLACPNPAETVRQNMRRWVLNCLSFDFTGGSCST
jgi:hypothetical protein